MGVRAARVARGMGRASGSPVRIASAAGRWTHGNRVRSRAACRTAAYASSPKSQGGRDVMPWKPPMS
ncbi:hypothetical protein ACFWIJ_00645 [Streptomyces sp. NPDC127079]|uniref:hypothetical protein n=1 Tax=Streptomyces sp. NPDC127079 TaxID=3347132 RepID=UPI0036600D63